MAKTNEPKTQVHSVVNSLFYPKTKAGKVALVSSKAVLVGTASPAVVAFICYVLPLGIDYFAANILDKSDVDAAGKVKAWTIEHIEQLKLTAEIYGAAMGLLLLAALAAAAYANCQSKVPDKSIGSPVEERKIRSFSKEENPYTIRTRHDVAETDIQKFQKENKEAKLRVYGPDWIKEELNKIWGEFAGKHFKIIDGQGVEIQTLIVPKEPSLEFLQLLARNEEMNTNGEIKTAYYNNFQGISRKAVLTLKDLVRHTLLISKAKFKSEGGYKGRIVEYKRPKEAYIIDLCGPQFQQKYNYGRNLFIPQTPYPPDKSATVYERLTGHPPLLFADIKQKIDRGDPSYTQRYTFFTWRGDLGYFDRYAYKQMVSQDFYLSAMAIQDLAQADQQEIDFRFLSYGTGAFAGPFATILKANILDGVLDGLEKLAAQGFFPSQIKRLTFPHYDGASWEQKQKIQAFCTRYGLDCEFTSQDALYQNPNKTPYTIAVTSTGDPNAPFANEVRYRSSVDAMLGCNEVNRGLGLHPLLVKPTEHLIAIPMARPLSMDYYKAAQYVEKEYKDSNLIPSCASYYFLPVVLDFLIADATDPKLVKFCKNIASSPQALARLRAALLFTLIEKSSESPPNIAQNMADYFSSQGVPVHTSKIFAEALREMHNSECKFSCPEARYLKDLLTFSHKLVKKVDLQELQKVYTKGEITGEKLKILQNYAAELIEAAKEINTGDKVLEQMALVPSPEFYSRSEKLKIRECNEVVRAPIVGLSLVSLFAKKPLATALKGTDYVFVPDQRQFLYDTEQTIQLASLPMEQIQAQNCATTLQKQLDQQGAWGLAASINNGRVYITGDPEVLKTLRAPTAAEFKPELPDFKPAIQVGNLLRALIENKLSAGLHGFEVQANTCPQNVMALSNHLSIDSADQARELGGKLKELNKTHLPGSGVYLTLTRNHDNLYQIMLLGSPRALQNFIFESSRLLENQKNYRPLIKEPPEETPQEIKFRSTSLPDASSQQIIGNLDSGKSGFTTTPLDEAKQYVFPPEFFQSPGAKEILSESEREEFEKEYKQLLARGTLIYQVESKRISLVYIKNIGGEEGFGTSAMSHLMKLSFAMKKPLYTNAVESSHGFYDKMGWIPARKTCSYVYEKYGAPAGDAVSKLCSCSPGADIAQMDGLDIKELKRILSSEKNFPTETITADMLREEQGWFAELQKKTLPYCSNYYIPARLLALKKGEKRDSSGWMDPEEMIPSSLGIVRWKESIEQNKNFEPFRDCAHLVPFMTPEQRAARDQILASTDLSSSLSNSVSLSTNS